MKDEENDCVDWEWIPGRVAGLFGGRIVAAILGAIFCAFAGWLGIDLSAPILAAVGAAVLMVTVLVWVMFAPPKDSRNGPLH